MNLFKRLLRHLFPAPAPKRPAYDPSRPVAHFDQVLRLIDNDWREGKAGVTLVVCGLLSYRTALLRHLGDRGTAIILERGADIAQAQQLADEAGVHDQVYIIGNKSILCAGWQLKTDRDVRMYSTGPLGRDYRTQLLSRWIKNGVRTEPVSQYLPPV